MTVAIVSLATAPLALSLQVGLLGLGAVVSVLMSRSAR